jgi:hypothetical protein
MSMVAWQQQKPGRPFRLGWDYVEYDVFFKDVDTSSLPPISFEPWVPPAVADGAKKIYAECLASDDPIAAAEPLLRLIADDRMKLVWAELYKKKRLKANGLPAYFYPMCMYSTSEAARALAKAADLRKRGGCEAEIKCLELEAKISEQTYDPYPLIRQWSEQDLGVQNLLWHIYRLAINIDPEYFSDMQTAIKTLCEVAKQLSEVSGRLRSKHPILALEKIGDACLDAAKGLNVDPKTDDPWIIVRDRDINDARLRTFVAHMCIAMVSHVGQEMCGTVATLANVVFERDDVSAGRVREMMRLPRNR